MTQQRRSLAKRLTSQLILWQILTLTAFVMCVPLVDFVFGGRTLAGPDPRTSSVIAEALQLTNDQLVLQSTDKLHELAAAAPELWFVVVGQRGNSVRFGAVPYEMARLAETFGLLDVEELRNRSYRYKDATLRLEPSPAGEVSVLFGGGPLMGPLITLARDAFGGGLLALLVILSILSLTTVFVIPRLIGNSLVGLRHAVSLVATIDLNRPGTRLPTADVPGEIAALVEAMNEALRRIDDGHERHQRFLADAAHELRTPIAILQNRIELQTTGETGNQLLLDVQRLANLAEQLLDLQRMDHQRANLRPVDLVALGRHVLSDLAPMAVSAGYEPHFTAEAVAVVVIGDSSAIERAIINIVQNAMAYGGNRGKIVVSVLKDRKVEVSDDGDGVPQNQREQIFEPFHRLKPIERGAGLGLNLVREIMRHHDGTISVSESQSGGACFVLHFSEVVGE